VVPARDLTPSALDDCCHVRRRIIYNQATDGGFVSVFVEHPEPYTVAELFAMPDDGMRREVLDGTLLVSPPPSVAHQLAAGRLRDALRDAAPTSVEVLEATGVLLPGGLLIPDVVVANAAAVQRSERYPAAADVLAVVEVVSGSSWAADRRWKPEAYAEAGIGCYWRVELAPQPRLALYVLDPSGYQLAGEGAAGAVMQIDQPYPLALEPARLFGPR
jgi:Uma2 family endonuclease